MAKWCGKIGYAKTTETEPGLWEDAIIERMYYGDVISDRRNRQNSGGVNDNINLANVISIIADPFAYENCSYMAYIEIMGAKWKISNIDASQRPRLVLTIGGAYNGEQA